MVFASDMRMDNDPGPPRSASAASAHSVRLRVPQNRPFWTYVILTLNALAFVATLALGRSFVLSWGAKVNEAILAGQVWRLATAIFLHVDVLHIAFNSYALFIFGPQVERAYGGTRFLLMYFLSGLGGSGLSFLLSPHPSVGASGAIFGLIGVMGAYLYRYRNQFIAGKSRLTNILGVVAYNLLYGFIVPAIDNWAHIGGLLSGLLLGWFLAPIYETVQPDPLKPPRLVDQGPRTRWVVGILLAVLGIGLVVAIGWLRWSR